VDHAIKCGAGTPIAWRILANASGPLARQLALPQGAPVERIQRVRLANGMPLSFDETYLAKELGEKVMADNLEFWGSDRMGWIASRDVGVVAATVLREGPAKHSGQNYWLSAEVAGGEELATLFSEAL
jgi:hypothetical protein